MPEIEKLQKDLDAARATIGEFEHLLKEWQGLAQSWTLAPRALDLLQKRTTETRARLTEGKQRPFLVVFNDANGEDEPWTAVGADREEAVKDAWAALINAAGDDENNPDHYRVARVYPGWIGFQCWPHADNRTVGEVLRGETLPRIEDDFWDGEGAIDANMEG